MECPDCLTNCSDASLFCPNCGFKFSPRYKELLQQLNSAMQANEKLRGAFLEIGGKEYLETKNAKELIDNELGEKLQMVSELQEEIEALLLVRTDLLNGIDIERKKWRKQRQREGIELAVQEGRYPGRPKVPVDIVKFEKIYPEWKAGAITARQFMKELGLKPNTFYRFLQNYELNVQDAQG